jgi:Rrf2 family protein
MRLPRTSLYALYGVAYLASKPTNGLAVVGQIARHFGVPEQSLAKILRRLARAGILRSVRGAAGGFVLAKEPAEVTMKDVVEAVDGPFAEGGCSVGDGRPCPTADRCGINSVWYDLQVEMLGRMSQITVKDLAAKTDTEHPCPLAEVMSQGEAVTNS